MSGNNFQPFQHYPVVAMQDLENLISSICIQDLDKPPVEV
jgi:hypothetical protein